MGVASCLFIVVAAMQTFAAMSIDTLKANLDGRWEWVQTYGGYAGDLFTPRSEGYSLALVFSKEEPQLKSDSIGYEVYRNDTLILSGYTTPMSSAVRIQPFGCHIGGDLVYKNDTLLVEIASVSDGYSTIFIRPTTSLKGDQPSMYVMVPHLSVERQPEQFTLSGRRITAGRYRVLPAQISVSRQHATVKGIKK